MFEHKSEKLLPWPRFVGRMAPSKIFASAYALFSGVVFLSAVGIVLAPVFHRVLHHFHLDEEDERADSK
jgi:hypothetical protein